MILSHHSRFDCDCNREEINDEDGDDFRFVSEALTDTIILTAVISDHALINALLAT